MRNKIYMAVMLTGLTISVQAQSSLTDYANGKVDLGLGIQQSRMLTTAATQTISGDELRKTSATTLKDALYGRLLGLTALNQGGFANGENNVRLNVRGIQTTSENNLLILVDGIERPIDYMTVEEVESVTVLRDAAAVAMLGYQGVNGAILIKTKRGQAGPTHVSASYNHKFTFSPKVAEFVDAHTYANAINRGRQNDGLTPLYNDYELEAYKNGNQPYYYPNTDWKKEVFRNMGAEDQVNLGLNGGNERLQYFANLNYTDTRGLLNRSKQGEALLAQNDDQESYSSQLKLSKANVRIGIDAQLFPKTQLQVNAFGSFFETNRPYGANQDGLTWMLYQTPASAFPVVNDPEGELAGIWGGNTTYGTNNPVAKILSSGYTKSHGRVLQGDITLKQDLSALLKGLGVRARFGYNSFSHIFEENGMGYEYGYQRYSFDANGNPTSLTTYKAGDKTGNLDFNYYINNHLRSSYLDVAVDWATQFRDDDNFKASLVWHQKNTTPSGQYATYNRMNWIAYAHYDLKERYIADLVLALNGSNRSYPEKWAFSPTLSLGYIFAKDPEAAVLNLGKLRASAGIQHTDYVPAQGIWLENYNGGGGDYIFGSGGGSQDWGSFIGYLPTTNFNLETAYKLNLGADLRLANQVDVTLDLFYHLRDDILLSGNGLNSAVLGIPSGYVNWGRVASYGAELGVNWVKKLDNDLAFNIGGNLTWGRNEQKRVIENIAYDYLSDVGGRVNQAWGLEVIGLFKDEADIENSPRQNFDICRPGDFKYKDQNGDGVISEDDVVKMGYDTAIPELNFSLNLGLRYRNFGVNALFQGVANYTQYLGTTGVWTPLIDGANLSTEYYKNCWDTMGEGATYPRLTSRSNQNNYRGNSVWWKNVSFLKLRNCEVYYHLPESIIQKIKLTDLKIFVKGENLLTLSNMKTMDPEVLGTTYPIVKGVTAGVSVQF